MKHIQVSIKRLTAIMCLLAVSIHAAYGSESVPVRIKEEDISVDRYSAKGESLVLFVSSGFGDEERVRKVSQSLAQVGTEVWVVDLLENLFLPRAVSSFRQLDGSFVSGLISAAHQMTGKNVTVMARGYTSIAALRGVHKWQEAQVDAGAEHDAGQEVYLNGVILISPELYQSIPDLGLEPVFVPVASATNVPVMIFQGGRRGNRWQLERVIAELRKGQAEVYYKLFPGVTGIFYREDKSPETLALLDTLHQEISRAQGILKRMPTPVKPVAIKQGPVADISLLDTTLKPFKGNPEPKVLDLDTAQGNRVLHKDYPGKVTLVNFWATWCRPCIEEIPSLNRLRKRMAGKPFELISVDYAEDPETIRQFLKNVDVDFPVLLDRDGKVSANWNVVVFPSTFVVGMDGKIQYGVKGAIQWDADEVVEQLDRLVKTPVN